MPPNLKRMTGKQLREIRESRGETMPEFGAYLAKLVSNKRPYTKQDVNAWETGVAERMVPLAIEMALRDTGEYAPPVKVRK